MHPLPSAPSWADMRAKVSVAEDGELVPRVENCMVETEIDLTPHSFRIPPSVIPLAFGMLGTLMTMVGVLDRDIAYWTIPPRRREVVVYGSLQWCN
ncbi:hypothetical protein NL676_025409 [Syzygium grande]|nr:hypothetical protein NL676_025409 [Syzygium grande]